MDCNSHTTKLPRQLTGKNWKKWFLGYTSEIVVTTNGHIVSQHTFVSRYTRGDVLNSKASPDGHNVWHNVCGINGKCECGKHHMNDYSKVNNEKITAQVLVDVSACPKKDGCVFHRPLQK